jgi:hypothetical protein
MFGDVEQVVHFKDLNTLTVNQDFGQRSFGGTHRHVQTLNVGYVAANGREPSKSSVFSFPEDQSLVQ